MTDSTAVRQPDCGEYDPNSLSVEQARLRIREGVKPIAGTEQIALRQALGRVLARDVRSPIDVPAQANSAMDGYAVRAADLPAEGEIRLQVAGTAWAGRPFAPQLDPGQCVRIMTGAIIPAGADTVVMQEHVTRDADVVSIGIGHVAGQNVRHAGEDLSRGQVVLKAGRELEPADLGLFASLGIGEVPVRRRLRVAFFSTGDELRSIGQALETGQIYDSNRYTLFGMLTRLQAEVIDMGVVPDEPDAVRRAFKEAADMADVVISSGGVSVGDADYVKHMLDELGEVSFWKIAMKPGRPLAFGHVGEAAFFGLPGNPVSVMATFYQFVQPALRHMLGESQTDPISITVPCREPIKKRPGRTDFQRGILERDAHGELGVRATGLQGSHVLSSMSQANCFMVLPADWGDVERGTLVEVQPFKGVLP